MAYFLEAAQHFRYLGSPRPRWRPPQFGGLGAMAMHWSLTKGESVLLSVPTGSGKTAMAMAAPFFLAEPPRRILVVVPSRALREQIAENFRTSELLRRIGALPEDFEAKPNVIELRARASSWADLRAADVVVALPNSISPSHYAEESQPPADLFDLVVVDEAHHTPAPTWLKILDHFESASVLLTATPVRLDGKRLPGQLVYYYPLRKALEEKFYKPVRPIILEVPNPSDRVAVDRAIADATINMISQPEHVTSVLLVRAGTRDRLDELHKLYSSFGLPFEILHGGLTNPTQLRIIADLRAGKIKAVGVVGMLGEGFDLPSIRIVAYHDKHKSLPATVQLIGRLARSDPSFPQESVLITVRDTDVFPELRGAVRRLYEEDADWSQVLPGVIDDDIQAERDEREFAEELGEGHFEIVPDRLEPLQRAIVYEIADLSWRPSFASGSVPDDLTVGHSFAGGRIVYSGVDQEGQILVIGVRHVSTPRWSTDPGLLETTYSLHIVGFRPAPRTDLPSLVFINPDSRAGQVELYEALGLDEVAEMVRPERIGQYLDGLERSSVSAVGLRNTNAANRGTATYRNLLGASVDRGLRAVDLTRNALGHVNLQVSDDDGGMNAGAALEKGKIWVTRYVPLRAFDAWIEAVASLLWFERRSTAGALLPSLSRGRRLSAWPEAPALAAELHPAMLGRGYEVTTTSGDRVAIEDVELFVAAAPFGELDGRPQDMGLPIIAVSRGSSDDTYQLVWSGYQRIDGTFQGDDLSLQRGRSESRAFSELLDEFPPTIYFLDGSTIVGHVTYAPDRAGVLVNPAHLLSIDWPNTDITAETDRTAKARRNGKRSVHATLIEWLAARDRRGSNRWIILNDGAGEIADVLVIEPLSTGEVHLGLWHAKASASQTPGLRINELQVVVAQAIRSRRWLPSLALWPELAARLSGKRSPAAVLQAQSDEPLLLLQYLGLADNPDEEFVPWTRRAPVVRGEIGIVQPGLSRALALAEPTDGSESGVLSMLTVVEDTTTADGHEVLIIGSP
jgi:superfamily II DNA or RNA helicase